MPRWVRWLQPLLSGVFTVDNLDYVRRDAYLTGVATGPVDVERLRRYTFISERGLTLYEPGLGALEMFLTARRFMYQQVYFHRTVRAIDLDLAEVFGAVDRGDLRRRLAGGAPGAPTPTSTNTRCSTRPPAGRAAIDVVEPAPRPGARRGRVRRPIAEAWRAILLRQPTWRSDAEIRAEYEAGARPDERIAALGEPEPGRVAIDLAVVDARPADDATMDGLLALEARDGGTLSVAQALGSRSPPTGSSPGRYRRIVPGLRVSATAAAPATDRPARSGSPGSSSAS